MSVLTTPALSTQELVRFLLARLDDDATELKRLARREPTAGYDGVRGVARLQTDLAAKRKVIGSLQQLLVLRDQPFEKTIRDHATQMLRLLALPYEQHARYRPEWRPSAAH
jgi:hypothetical protein